MADNGAQNSRHLESPPACAAYALRVTAMMRLSLKYHREGCCCPGSMRLPIARDCVVADATLNAASGDELASIADCARFSLLQGATGTERNSLWGLVRRAKSGVVWIEERTRMLQRLTTDGQLLPWADHDPRRDGESWEATARRVGWLLEQQQSAVGDG